MELYYEEKAHPTERRLMAAMCHACPIFRECEEWAVARERWGFWAGMTQTEREQIRTERGIAVDEPQHVILPWHGDVADDSAA
jgi:predicted RecB family nuclease